jgi:hypothetical protein
MTYFTQKGAVVQSERNKTATIIEFQLISVPYKTTS